MAISSSRSITRRRKRGRIASRKRSISCVASKPGTTPVAFARAVGRADEKLTLTTLAEADGKLADMATLVVIGSSETRFIVRDGERAWMVTPRAYGARR